VGVSKRKRDPVDIGKKDWSEEKVEEECTKKKPNGDGKGWVGGGKRVMRPTSKRGGRKGNAQPDE